MIGFNSLPGYRPLSLDYSIEISKSAVLPMSENSSYKQRNLQDVAAWLGKLKAIRKLCFAMAIRGSVRNY